MTRTLMSGLLSHWRHRPGQLVTLLLALALATALFSGVQAINAEARASYDRAAAALGGDGADTLRAPGGGQISHDTYVGLRQAGWQLAPVLDGWLDTGAGRVRLIGLDPLNAPPGNDAAGAAINADPGAFLSSEGLLLVAPATTDRLAGAEGLPPVAATDGLAPGIAFADMAVAQRLLQTTGYSSLVILPDQPLRQSPLADVAPDLVRASGQTADDLGRLTDSFHLNLTAFGFLSFAVGLFIVHGAVGLAFEQRRTTFRTLRALGVSTRALVAAVAAELLIFALIAGAVGIALGYLIAAVLLPDVAATLRGLYGASVEGALSLSPWWWLSGLVIATAGTAIAAGGSLFKLARLPVLAAARPRAWSRTSVRQRAVEAAGAAALLLLALGLALFGRGLVAGFVTLGALLLAAALLLPLVLAAALGLGQAMARGPLAQWFWADTRQNLPGLSLALMALLLALAANIGVGTMVQSFRTTFTGWLDQRLASELYVRLPDTLTEADLRAALGADVRAILPIWNADTDLLGAPGAVFGVIDHATYRDNWPLLDALPDVWDAIAAGDAVLVNEQIARREDLAPGDPFPLAGRTLTIAGIYSDYGNPQGQAIIAQDTLLALFDRLERGNYGLRVDPARTEEIAARLTDTLGLDPDAVIDQRALKQFSLGIFERTFAVTGALNVLTLGVAGLAILTSLLTLSTLRLPQLAPVWAIGLTRATLARLELLRTCLLAALTFVAAIPVGLLLAYILLAVINVEAFGWRLPMQLFPGDWVWLGALSLLAAGLAGLWPAWRLWRRPPADLIGVFVHER